MVMVVKGRPVGVKVLAFFGRRNKGACRRTGTSFFHDTCNHIHGVEEVGLRVANGAREDRKTKISRWDGRVPRAEDVSEGLELAFMGQIFHPRLDGG